MPNFNKCIFVGHMTRDPQTRYTQNQTAVCDFGIAVNHKYKDKEEVMFLDCTAFGQTAETIVQYFTKGKPILVEGRLKLDQWDDKQTGAKRSKHVLVVDRFTFVGGDKPEQRPYPRTRESIRDDAAMAPTGPFPDSGGPPEEDIPF